MTVNPALGTLFFFGGAGTDEWVRLIAGPDWVWTTVSKLNILLSFPG